MSRNGIAGSKAGCRRKQGPRIPPDSSSPMRSASSALGIASPRRAGANIIKFFKSWLPSDILLAAHHGSSNGCVEDAVELIAPRYTVISCGEDNPHGHPHRDAVEIYTKHTSEDVYITHKVGSILFESDSKSITNVILDAGQDPDGKKLVETIKGRGPRRGPAVRTAARPPRRRSRQRSRPRARGESPRGPGGIRPDRMTAGQRLAVEQLQAVELAGDGVLQVVSVVHAGSGCRGTDAGSRWARNWRPNSPHAAASASLGKPDYRPRGRAPRGDLR